MRGPAAALALSMATSVGLGCAARPETISSLGARPLAAEKGRLDRPSPLGASESSLPRTIAPPAAPPSEAAPVDRTLRWDAPNAEPALTAIRCPKEMALVGDRVCVDRWEATVVELRDGREAPLSPYHPLDDHPGPFRAVSRPDVVPQGYISGTLAARACRSAGKRLCAADEWVLACRGPSKKTFPYGDGRRAGVCNDDVRALHPVVEASRAAGLHEDQYWREGMNLPAINQLDHALEETGERAMCTTDEGVYDMVGNLHEWVDDPEGTFRGGFYMDTTQNGEGCSYQTTAHAFGYHDYSTGFRCCMDPYDVE